MKWIVLFLAIAVVGCATVNVYVTFPEEKIRKAADDLLGPVAPSRPAGQSRFNLDGASTVHAQGVVVSSDLKTSSPLLDEIRARRMSWLEKIQGFKSKGYLGERNNFLLEIRDLPGDSKAAAEVREYMEKENRERDLMITELMRVNSAAKSQEATFRSIFADSMIKKYTDKGCWIQLPSGEWKRKE